MRTESSEISRAAEVSLASEVSGRHVRRVRHELKRRELHVLRVETISPHFRRVTFGGDALADFVSDSFDDHVKLILDAGGAAPVRRDYTPRHFDTAARELSIELALHGDGPAARWAAQAAAGQHVVIGGPRGSLIIPADFAWHLLMGDETALPAVARRLEELPAGSRAIVILQVNDRADQRALACAAGLELRWLADSAQFLQAARALQLPPGEGYVWCAGEAAVIAALRRILVDEKGCDPQRVRAAAYWKHSVSAHHENLEG